MSNLNKVFLIGRLTANPELRATPDGNQIVNIRLATNYVFTKKDGTREESVDFHSVKAWGRIAEIVAGMARKGTLVLIEGSNRSNNWTDKNGTKHYGVDVIAQRISVLSHPKDKDSEDAPVYQKPEEEEKVADEEMPF